MLLTECVCCAHCVDFYSRGCVSVNSATLPSVKQTTKDTVAQQHR